MVSVGIEIIDEVVAFSFCSASALVLFEVKANLWSSDQSVVIMVEDLEGGIETKVWDGTEFLSTSFNVRLTFMDSVE